MTLEELDAEAHRVRAHTRWLKEDTIAEFAELLENETNPYTREFLMDQIEKVRAVEIPELKPLRLPGR